jgi:hypothetical protein
MERKGTAIDELSRATKFLQRSFQFLSTLCNLFDTLNMLSTEGEIDTLIQKVIQSGAKLTNCDRMSFWIAERAGDGKLWTRFPRTDGGFGLVTISLKKTDGLVGACFTERRPLLIPDAYQDPRFFKGADKKNHYKTNAMLCIPIIREGSIVAVVQAINPLSVESSQFGSEELFLAYMLGNHTDGCVDERRRVSKEEWYNKRRLFILQAAEETLNRAKKHFTQPKSKSTQKKALTIDRRAYAISKSLELMQNFFPHSVEPRLYIVYRDFVLRMNVDPLTNELRTTEAPDKIGQIGECLARAEEIIGEEKNVDPIVDITPPLGGCVYTCPIFTKSEHGRRRKNVAVILQWSMVAKDVSMSQLDDGSHVLQNDPHNYQQPAMNMLKRTIGGWIEKCWAAMARYSMASAMRKRVLNWSRHADETLVFYAVTTLQSLFRRNKSMENIYDVYGWHVKKTVDIAHQAKRLEKRLKQEKIIGRLKDITDANAKK